MHQYANHRQQRPVAVPNEEEFLFDVESEMAVEEGPLRSVSLYVQPVTGKRRTVVCKHWLRGLCKKGDLCDYLHEYDEDKMPICQFYFSDKVLAAHLSSYATAALSVAGLYRRASAARRTARSSTPSRRTTRLSARGSTGASARRGRSAR